MATAASLQACQTTPPPPPGPDCRPMRASVQLSCWQPGRGQALRDCKVEAENPVGCGLGPAALAHFEGRIDLSLFWYEPNEPRGWISFGVYRDATGKVGRPHWPHDGTPRPFIYDDKVVETP